MFEQQKNGTISDWYVGRKGRLKRLPITGADGKTDLRSAGRGNEYAAQYIADQRLDLNLEGGERGWECRRGREGRGREK